MIDKQIFFILGAPRSGTTLLRLMLNAHSSISVPPEAGFSVWLEDEYGQLDYSNVDNIRMFTKALEKTKKIETWNINFPDLLDYCINHQPANYRNICGIVYSFYAKSKHKSAFIYGDKNNFYVDYLSEISNAKIADFYVQIVRDGRDIACSYLDLMSRDIDSKYAPNLPTDIQSIASKWSEDIKNLNSFESENQEITYRVRYEDLVKSPKNTLDGLFSFMNIPYESNVLEYHLNAKLEEPSEFFQWKENISKPIFEDSVRRFERLLTREQIETFNSVAGVELSKLNYTV